MFRWWREITGLLERRRYDHVVNRRIRMYVTMANGR